MSQLVQLRQKIRSIQNTKKITHAVRLVSMSFYNKLDKLNAPLKNYSGSVRSFFLETLAYAPGWKNDVLFPIDIFDATPLFVVVATTKGLCGSLNSNLFRYVDSSLFIEKRQAPKFIAIGQRAITFLKDKDLGEIVCSYADLNSNNFIAVADDLVDKILNGSYRYTSVSFFHSTAKSFFTQLPQKSTVIPMSLASVSDSDMQAKNLSAEPVNDSDATIWEQPQEQLLEYLAMCYLRSSIMHLLFQALRAEQAARFLAMENSTNNAEKYLERLTLQFNKLRQALITKEVSELSASFPTR